MTRISPWALVLALAVSACGNGGAGNAVAAEAAGNASAGLQAAQAGGSATSSQSTASNAPSGAQPGGAATTLPGMPRGEPLGPILDEDFHSPDRMGCTCMFNAPEGTYLSVLDRELMVRTPAGLQLCPIADGQLQSLGQPGSDVACAGVRISVRETDARVADIEADSASAPAILSATQGGVTRTLDGEWGCAC